MKARGWCLLALVVAALAGGVWWAVWHLPRRADPGGDTPVYFEDVTAASGLDFTYRNGEEADHYAILESLGGGVALIDYDGDGLLDIFLPGGGTFAGEGKKDIRGLPCRLYRNLGGLRFEDVTAKVGLDKPWFYTHGAAVADYDRDGWPDLLVTGYGRLALFRNVGDGAGGRKFVEVTRDVGLAGGHFWGTSAAFADLDGDGYPDLYACQYVDWSFENNPRCEGYRPEIERDVCPPKQFEARPHALYRNDGGRRFTEVGKEAGLHAERAAGDYERLTHLDADARKSLREADRDREYGKGLGVVILDLDGDGKPDVYVANDTTDKFLYLNRGTPGKLRFEDQALWLGVARDAGGAPNGSMGLDAADYDGSGRPSLWVTNYENEYPALYRNVSPPGRLKFQYESQEAGLQALGRQYVGFGTGFLDADNDGWKDIVIVNGHVIRHPANAQVRQMPLLLRNEGGRFASVGARAGDYFRSPHQGRGLAVGDLDNDGWPDVVISHLNAPAKLLRNAAPRDAHWLGVVLADRKHRDLVGARLTLEAGGRSLTAFAKAGGSYLSSGDPRHLFGLGKAESAGRLKVVWPWGEVGEWDGLKADRYWVITAGGDAPRELPRPASPPGAVGEGKQGGRAD